MKLWHLGAKRGLPENDDPWDPWYDKNFALVVRAETERAAREIADSEAADENRGEFLGLQTSNTNHPWLDEKYSTCVELLPEGVEGLIIVDFAAA